MKFFKYLIFIILSVISINSFAANYNWSNVVSGTESSICQNIASYLGKNYRPYKQKTLGKDILCTLEVYRSFQDDWGSIRDYTATLDSSKCPPSGSPIINYFEVGEKTPLQTCTQNSDGTYCIAKAKSSEPLVLHGGTYLGVQHKSQVTLYSLSETPSSSCSPETSTSSCNALDPYGPCFKVPNDGCTRARDGSINCPQNIEKTPTQDTCNGASYCARPSTGCGSGYVSGSFNGDSLCVKKSLSGDTTQTNDVSYTASNTDGSTTSLRQNADGSTSLKTQSKDGSNTSLSESGSDGKGSTIKTSNGTTTAQSSTTTTTTSEGSVTVTTTNADGSVTKVTISKDGKNVKTTTTDPNGNTASVDSIQVESTNPTDANSTDLSGVISAINAAKTAIVSAVDKVKDTLSDIQDFLSGDVDTSSMTDVEVPQKQLDEKSFSENLYSSSAQCPVDRTLSFKLLGRADFTKTFSFQMLCDHLSIFGQLIMLASYIYAARIVTRDS